MNLNKEAEAQLEELQMFEQQFQSILAEKQTLQIEFNEIENATTELAKTKDDVYRIIGGIMLKSDKDSLLKELTERKKMVGMRVSSVEKQENLLMSKIENSRNSIRGSLLSTK